MSDDLYIVIPDWDRFEHPDVQRYETPPPWIKSYTRELDEDAYQDLTSHCRALLHDLRGLYAIKRRRLRLDTATLSRRFGYRVTTPHIESLNHAGFIRIEACHAQAVDVDVDVDQDRRGRTSKVDPASAAADGLVVVADAPPPDLGAAVQDGRSTPAGDGSGGRKRGDDPSSSVEDVPWSEERVASILKDVGS